MRQAAFLGDLACGVVTTFKGFGISVRNTDFENAAKKVRPEDYQRLLGEKYEISGLPMSTGKDVLIEFVDGWNIIPLYSFRQGFCRTWVVRAGQPPQVTVVQHDYGLAVIKGAQPRKITNTRREHWVPPHTNQPLKHTGQRTWAKVVAKPTSTKRCHATFSQPPAPVQPAKHAPISALSPPALIPSTEGMQAAISAVVSEA